MPNEIVEAIFYFLQRKLSFLNLILSVINGKALFSNNVIIICNQVRIKGIVKREYLQSTNLIHLTAMVERLFASRDRISVMHPFKDTDSTRLEVDIVCDSGASWVKVIARNARALTLISLGNAEYGQKSVLDQAEMYLRCASFHPHCYKAPTVVFHFAYGVEAPLAKQLKELGIVVEGNIVNDKIGT